MRGILSVLPSFDLKRHSERPLSSVPIIHYHLDSGIDIAFETKHWGPYMLFDVKQLVDAHDCLCTIPVFDNGLRLRIFSLIPATVSSS